MVTDEIQDDVYKGLKSEWKFIPWTVISVMLLWASALAVYLLIYPGLAKATDFKDLNSRLYVVQIQLLDQQIITTKSLGCKSPSRRYFTERLTELLRQYTELTHNSYPLPDCKDLD